MIRYAAAVSCKVSVLKNFLVFLSHGQIVSDSACRVNAEEKNLLVVLFDSML